VASGRVLYLSDVLHVSINNILQHNYNIDIIGKLSTKKEKLNTSKNQEKTKWATFTYIGKETRKMTKIFQNTK
jgi:hypothetical protein